MIIVIGSCALLYQLNDRHVAHNCFPKDLDMVTSFAEAKQMFKDKKVTSCYPVNGGKKIIFNYALDICEPNCMKEIELTWEGSTAKMLHDLVLADADTREFKHQLGNLHVASIDMLYTLKMTHRYKKNSPHFLKTMRDIKTLRSMGAKIREEFQKFYELRMAETYNYAHPKLNVKKTDFFKGDGVNYVYDHDSIHEAIKHYPRPAYSFFKPANSEVLTCRATFEILPAEIKLLSVLEEAYVLALERSQIPFKGKVTPLESFTMALEKVCTSITSGWWREYAWEHYDEVMKMYNENYVNRFLKAVELGAVKFHEGKNVY